MSSLLQADFLALLTQGDTRQDVMFEFEDTAENVCAHKLLLSSMSPVFREQFYGPLSANAKAEGNFSGCIEVVKMKEFQYHVVFIFVRHIYGDKKIIKKCSSFVFLFELLDMAKKYLVEKMGDLILKRISEVDVTLETAFLALETSLQYKDLDGFEEISEVVDRKIVATLSALSRADQNKFYKQYQKDKPDLVFALIDLMSEDISVEPETNPEPTPVAKSETKLEPKAVIAEEPIWAETLSLAPNAAAGVKPKTTKPKSAPHPRLKSVARFPTCSNCLMQQIICKHGRPIDAVPHIGMKMINYLKDNVVVEAVMPTNGRGQDGEVIFNVTLRGSPNQAGIRPVMHGKYPAEFQGDRYNCNGQFQARPAGPRKKGKQNTAAPKNAPVHL